MDDAAWQVLHKCEDRYGAAPHTYPDLPDVGASCRRRGHFAAVQKASHLWFQELEATHRQRVFATNVDRIAAHNAASSSWKVCNFHLCLARDLCVPLVLFLSEHLYLQAL